jgi:hypothetical protein
MCGSPVVPPPLALPPHEAPSSLLVLVLPASTRSAVLPSGAPGTVLHAPEQSSERERVVQYRTAGVGIDNTGGIGFDSS